MSVIEPTPATEPVPAEVEGSVETVVHPTSRCGDCGITDDEPKHQILVGLQNPATNGELFHEHDHDRDGVIHYHFHCHTPWHQAVSGEYHAKLAELSRSGVRGDSLREQIKILSGGSN